MPTRKWTEILFSLMRSRSDSLVSSQNNRLRDIDDTQIIVTSDSVNNFTTSNSNSSHSSPRNSMAATPMSQLTVEEPPVKSHRRSQDMTGRNIGVRASATPSLYSMMEMTPAERSYRNKKNLTVMFSNIYAVLVTVIGGVIYINYQNPDTRYICEIFSSCMAMIGFSWLMFFHIDLFMYKRRVIAKMMQWKEGQSNRSSIDYSQASWVAEHNENPRYRFLTGRHSGSFYLKAGLAAFCFGHLINEGLQLGQEVINYSQSDRMEMNCGQLSSVVIHCIRPLYSFYQLFIIFKYANIIINKYKELARFALMHIIATCVCFWFGAIVQDALEDYHHKLADNIDKNATDAANKSIGPCVSDAILSVNNLEAIPYLYPFTVEFNILLAGVWFILWNNIGKHHQHSKPHHFSHKIHNDDGIEEVTFQSNLVINADCHASNKGLFLGLFLLMTAIISVIVFFVAMGTKGYVGLGISLHTIQETVMTLVSLIGVILAYRQLSKLDFNLHPITFLDDVLLFVPLPFFFVNSILSITAEVHEENLGRIIISTLITVQVILQTPFISDGLRRCSNSQKLRFQKPGREIVTFLIVCNLTMWIINTFEVKRIEPYQAQHEFYGEFIWMFVGHTTLPLMLFYRFHSSVCLADIWKSAFEKGQ